MKKPFRSPFPIFFVPAFLFAIFSDFYSTNSALAGQLFFLQDRYGPNEVVQVSGELDIIPTSECSDPNGRGEGTFDFFPSALIYVVSGGTISPGTTLRTPLIDLSGSPNLIQGTGLGGAFFDEVIATTQPTGNLGIAGMSLTYQAVLDECRDGYFNPQEDSWADFTVFIPTEVPPISQFILDLKAKAEQRAIAASDAGVMALLVFIGENIWQINQMWKNAGNVSGFVKDLVCQLADESFPAFIDAIANAAKLNPKISTLFLDFKEGGFAEQGLASFLVCGHGIPKSLDDALGIANPTMGTKIEMEIKALMAVMNEVKHQASIAADPPDLDFLQATPIGAINQFNVATGDPVEFTIVDLERNWAFTEVVSRALLASLEKYQGAQIAGDGISALIHACNLSEYALLLSYGLSESNRAIDAFLSALRTSGRNIEDVMANAITIQNRLIVDGFSEDEKRLLRNLGHTDEAIEIITLLMKGVDFSFPEEAGGLHTFFAEFKNQNDVYVGTLQEFSQNMDDIIHDLESKIPEQLPIARPDGPYSGFEGQPLSFDGSSSADFAGGGLTLSWDLDGDGEFDDASGAIVSATYDESRSSLIGLKVTDVAGRSDVSYAPIEIEEVNLPPVIVGLSPPSDQLLEIHIGTTIQLSLQVTDPDNDFVDVIWYIDDEEMGTGSTLTYVAQDPGIHFLRVEARDNHPLGGITSQSRNIFVTSSNLVVDAFDLTPLYPTDAETVTLTAFIENDGMADAENVVVSFFQGDPETGGTPVGLPQTIPGLAAGETVPVSVEFETFGRGGQIIPLYVQVDPDGAIAELNEEDNTHSRLLYVRRSTPLAGVDMDWSVERTILQSDRFPYTSLALVLDSQDRPRLAGTGPRWETVVRYAWKSASGWGYADLPDNANQVFQLNWASLALDAADRPHIAYHGPYVRYAHFDGAQWNFQTLDSGAYPFQGDQTSIQVDTQGRPHIAYHGRGDLRYVWFDGGAWHKEIGAAATGPYVIPKLALDSQGRPHILYQTAGALGNKYVYAYRDEVGWHRQEIDARGGTWTRASICLDAEDRPHIAGWNATENVYKYGYLTDGQWHLEEIEGQIPRGFSTDISLCLTNQGVPVAAYTLDDGVFPKLHYAARLEEGWDVQVIELGTVPPFPSLVAYSPRMALSAEGYPFIAFSYNYEPFLVTGAPIVPEPGTDGYRIPQPVANGPYAGYEGEPLFVDAFGSTDPDGHALRFRWDFDGDGVFDSELSAAETASYVYADDYAGIATVEAIDPTGLSGIASTSVTVENVAPQVNAGWGGSLKLGQTFSLDASFTDPGLADTHIWKVAWGDGSTTLGVDLENEEENSIAADHLYAAAGNYTVTVEVDDDDGGTGEDQVQVTVEAPVPADAAPPVIALRGDNPLFVECGGEYFDPGATAVDDVDGDLTASIRATGAVEANALGTYTVTYAVADAAGNSASTTRTVQVVDTTPPAIALTGDNPLVIAYPAPYAELDAEVSDLCDADPHLEIDATRVDAAVLGTYEVAYTATDAAGNSASATRMVQVVDTTPPVIALQGDPEVIVECCSAYQDPGVAALDDYDGDLSGDVQVENPADLCAPGTYTLTYTVSDASGNAAEPATRAVRVVDTTPPAIALTGADPLFVECTLEAYAEPGAQVSDACDADPALTVEGTVDATALGEYRLTYTATDASGNRASVDRTVIVHDTTPPAIALTGADPLFVECALEAYAEPGAQVSDACDADPALTAEGTVDATALGEYRLTYTATDASGNRASVDRTVIVRDTTPPAVTILSPAPAGAFLTRDRVDVEYAVGDACDPLPEVAVSPGDPLGPPLEAGELEIAVTATDASGNQGSAAVTVTVRPIPAGFDFDPNTLNIASGNGTVTGYIELARDDGDCAQIDLHSLVLEGPLGSAAPITDPKFGFVSSESSYCVDEDKNGLLERLVKFQRADVVEIVEEPGAVLTIRGRLLASSAAGAAGLEGADEIRVIRSGNGKGKAKLVDAAADTYELFPSFPNPFNTETQIVYQIPAEGEVSLAIYNLTGQQVRVLVQGTHGPGRYQAVWDGRDENGAEASSGIYIYRLVSERLVQTRRMILLK